MMGIEGALHIDSTEVSTPELVGRLIAYDSSGVVARIAIRCEDSLRATVGAPRFEKGDLTSEEKISSCVCLLHRALDFARNWGCHLVEATPSTKTADLAEWAASLKAVCFTQTAERMLLSHEAGTCTGVPEHVGASCTKSAEGLGLGELCKLFQSCQALTSDRADADIMVDVVAEFDEFLRNAGSADRSSWRVATDLGVPVGLSVIEMRGDCTWIAYIGILPAFRRRGIGSNLLRATVAHIQSCRDVPINALVDCENLPSLAMHSRCGFVVQAERHYLYRLPIPKQADLS